jgi:hypothetical protein
MQICKNCQKEFDESTIKVKLPSNFCSNKCYEEYKKWNNTPNTESPVCHKQFYIKPSVLQRNGKWGTCCCKECSIQLRSIKMKGEGNHQYGLKGELNASFKGGVNLKSNNKLTERYIYVGSWYKKKNMHGRITIHRYNVEVNHSYFNKDFFEEIDGWFYLKRGLEVHHKDLDHNNNDLSNLEVLTKGEHVSLHNKLRDMKRNSKGQFIKQQ